MILIDTSVWVDHFRRRNPQLVRLLEYGEDIIEMRVVLHADGKPWGETWL